MTLNTNYRINGDHMAALEEASVNGNIIPLTQLLAGLLSEL